MNHSLLVSEVLGGDALTVSGHLGAFQRRKLQARELGAQLPCTNEFNRSWQSGELTQKVL